MASESIPVTPAVAPRPAERGRTSRFAPEWLLAVPFLAPALIFYIIFLLVPLVGTLALSVTSWSGFNFADIQFVGLQNFRALGNDNVFWQSLQHNVMFLVGSVILKTT